MKSCLHCKHAKWVRDKRGGLHRSGDGYCQYVVREITLPAAMYWVGGSQPRPCGGSINRKREHKEHCPCFEREQPVTPSVTPQGEGSDHAR